ncbi:tyrosinase [Pyrenophora seminiperda CCB06]|uniref:Tyrosinase n=1 Tax=Pyrenophora seminiperda CCB06 TaxID=1302712 RepID=A0A3M7MJ68_9PLEO|nr:tyrosinase [Pyrenophora seminiperda CCB06]
MRSGILSASMALLASVSALPAPQEAPSTKIVNPLPIVKFAETQNFSVPVLPEAAKVIFENYKVTIAPEQESKTSFLLMNLAAASGSCANPRVRVEWDSYSDDNKQAFVNSIKCLMGKAPSGQFPASKSRYEDLVSLHQGLTPNVHGNAKFLLWHRYLTWTFEDILRTECGLSVPMPWFDETRYAGRFAQSSIFSSRWLGSIAVGGNCVTDGQFANLAINIGPGSGNQLHCLSRNGDGAKTQYCNSAYVDQCNAYGDFAGMASCAETGPHAWGHNGIGAVMQDTYASPADPIFWLHHGFVDRNFRIWQNGNPGVRTTSINGNDHFGNPLTLDTVVSMQGVRPDIKVRDILDTTGQLCYKYNY